MVYVNGVLGPKVASVTQNSTNSKLALWAANTYTGVTTVTAGTLGLSSFQGSAASSAITVNGGVLAIDSLNGASAASVTRAASVTLNNGTTMTVTGGTANTQDVITGALTTEVTIDPISVAVYLPANSACAE